LVLALPCAASAKPFNTEWLKGQAKALAQASYSDPGKQVPDWVEQLSYDQHRDIRFRPPASVWKREGLPFHLQMFHLGYIQKTPVEIHLVKNGDAELLKFSTDFFDYGKNVVPQGKHEGLNFAGFRVHYPLNRPDYYDEAIVFLGATYFRSLGKNEVYGLSARGLAIDTAEPKGEEFPVFRKFFIEQPEKNAKQLVIHALMDSPSAAGAFTFVVKPGTTTTVDVTSWLYPRKAISVLGIAPLTSMFLHGENNRTGVDDFRPEVHDSDGLLIWSGNGERLWRPLVNPRQLRLSSFQVDDIKGFGLLQRDQAFSSYQDLESHYERRPSAWVEPVGSWGKGTIRILELPTQEEIHDNITAFWMPAAEVKPGKELKFAYRLHWGPGGPPPAPVGRTLSTHVGAGPTPKSRKYVVDFSAPEVTAPTSKLSKEAKEAKAAAAAAPVEAAVWTSAGTVKNVVAHQNEMTGGWRAFFDLEPGDAQSIEMRCFIKKGDGALTETWSNLWMK
jgi:glucans biosynthesis protein